MAENPSEVANSTPKRQGLNTLGVTDYYGGAKRDRTADLLTAREARGLCSSHVDLARISNSNGLYRHNVLLATHDFV